MERDYRSLEHKIRDLMMETMARNSAKRMQVTNVARPDTATDPTDVKSKIAKQGEIKTKIIDEDTINEGGEIAALTAGIRNMKKNASQSPAANPAKPDDAWDKAYKDRIAADAAKAKKVDTSAYKKKTVEEEVIDEAAEDNAPEVADKKKGDDDTAPKKSKSGDMDDKDAKEIKGGKTEVDLDPKTDDDPDESAEEDKKSKKATKDENDKIGAKKSVKEESMKNTPFGLPQGLIDAVSEALKGDQHKIDANKNGKIDSQDFKILRGETKAKVKPQMDKARPAFKEEVEEVSEGGLVRPAKIEVKKQSLGDGTHVTRINHGASHGYVLHPEHSAAIAKLGHGEHTKFKDETGNRVTAHRDGEKIHLTGDPAATGTTKTTVDRKHFTEEVEQVDEVLDNPVKKMSYISKAYKQIKHADPIKMANNPKEFQKVAKRTRGMQMLNKKLTKEEVEVSEEQLNELSPKTLRSYASKAQRQVDYTDTRGFGTKGGGVPVYYKGKKKELGKDPVKVYKNRKAGAEQAWKKSHKTNEEVQLSAEELARIESIAKGME
jgi:hypothetical protein